MRIGVVRLWHEANSFAATPTTMSAFYAREWLRGQAVADWHAGAATEIGGARDWARGQGDVDLVFSRSASAPPGGPVEQAVLDEFIEEVVADPALGGVDGVYLSLHGACLGTQDLTPEATLLRRLRVRFPDLPFAASFDMHACLSADIAAMLDAATVYRTYPHVDMDSTAARALVMLAGMIRSGRRLSVRLATIGRVLPSFNMRTDDPALPMARAQMHAAHVAALAGQAVAVFPYGSFAYADGPATDAGAIATAEDGPTAQAAADAVARFLSDTRAEYRPRLRSAAACIAGRPWEKGRAAILEPSDNPLSGGQGDTPGLLAAVLGGGVPDGTVFAFFCDPQVVETAQASGLGARFQVALGGRLDRRFGDPIPLDAIVERLTDGRFVNEGPMERGVAVDLGPTCVLRSGPLSIVVTSGCQSPNDIAWFRLHGIDLDRTPLLLAKAKNHFMAALGPRFHHVEQCDTPGPAMADATRLPFRHVPAARLDLA